ncbi:MAG TPA: TIGR00730 family Rossman fold protein [Spirochaetota bacterium]|nr:TIGR00730 family Rossman fold protein [Spirochaetota bacterium]
MKRICVFCGSSPGNRPEYRNAARSLGSLLAERNIGLVFGGGRVGLMNEIANAVLDAGGRVTGVIPQSLVDREVAHTGVSDLRIVGSMHERKALMAELSDGFIAMPGGIGTFEEFLEIITWGQLGFHRKPCGLLNVLGFYNGLLGFLGHAVDEGFLHSANRDSILVSASPEELLDLFHSYEAPLVDKAEKALKELDN